MVKHIVMFTLKEFANGQDKAANALAIKRGLEGLNGRIKGLRSLEVGLDFSRGEASADIVLYSEFDSRADLQAYQQHPEHLALLPLISEARLTRSLVDYECE